MSIKNTGRANAC